MISLWTRKGGVWAATRNGIGYIKDTSKPEEFELYGYSHGLEDTFVRSIQKIYKEISGSVPTMAFLYGTSKTAI